MSPSSYLFGMKSTVCKSNNWFIILLLLGGVTPALTVSKALLSRCGNDVDCIIRRHTEAIGGRDTLLALKTISRVGTIEFFKNSTQTGPEGKFLYHTDIIYPHNLREELKNTNILIDRGTNGEKYWEWTGSKYEAIVAPEKQKSMNETAERANRDLLWIRDEISNLRVTERSPAWAADSTCLEGIKEHAPIFVCFDKESGLLSAKGNDEEYRVFSHWTRAKAILLPFRLSHFRKAKLAYEIVLSLAQVDEVIDPLRFLPPHPF